MGYVKLKWEILIKIFRKTDILGGLVIAPFYEGILETTSVPKQNMYHFLNEKNGKWKWEIFKSCYNLKFKIGLKAVVYISTKFL